MLTPSRPTSLGFAALRCGGRGTSRPAIAWSQRRDHRLHRRRTRRRRRRASVPSAWKVTTGAARLPGQRAPACASRPCGRTASGAPATLGPTPPARARPTAARRAGCRARGGRARSSTSALTRSPAAQDSAAVASTSMAMPSTLPPSWRTVTSRPSSSLSTHSVTMAVAAARPSGWRADAPDRSIIWSVSPEARARPELAAGSPRARSRDASWNYSLFEASTACYKRRHVRTWRTPSHRGRCACASRRRRPAIRTSAPPTSRCSTTSSRKQQGGKFILRIEDTDQTALARRLASR